ncbi:Ig-like domain repeat protein [Candidatus Magnetominusculus dajiuhuensis]|uniref:RCC1 domain-containing protein n=1 Tax=Candidatus Magnetominusculus dajiuhuensis TaxID=3137712 RepID=UPI003B439F8F
MCSGNIVRRVVFFVVFFISVLCVSAYALAAVSVSAGGYHSAGIKSDSTLWTWGYNGYGELGDNNTLYYAVFPEQIGTSAWASVATGYYHTLGIKSDGTLWAWGYDYYGQVGDNSTSSYVYSPKQIGTSKWSSITAGVYHTLGIKSDGTLWAWGYNYYGQLGDGTYTSRYSPVQIGTSANWVSVTAGYYHSLGIKSDGTLWAWGYNGYGQLGDNNTSTYYVTSPEQIGTSQWSSISAGGYHTLGLKSDGTLWAWGYDYYGQVGDNSTLSYVYSPKQIGTSKWSSISAGDYHTLGIKSDGTLWAWGYGSYGQLGDNNTTAYAVNSPEQIGTSAWASVSAGSYHSLGVQSDGTLWAWGYNGEGQLGDGTYTTRFSPVQVGVWKAAGTTTTINSSLNPSTYGASVTFIASVYGSLPTGPPPTGTITFMDNATVLSTVALNSSAQAAYTTSALTTGRHPITAIYSGDTVNPASTSIALVQTVLNGATQTVVTSSLNPSTYGAAVTFTATVTGSSPTGTVVFADGTTVLSAVTLNSSAKATYTTSTLSVGTHSIVAGYLGDAANPSSLSAALVQTVTGGTSQTVVTSSLNPSTYGAAVTFTATVTGSSPTGTVAFADGTTILSTVTLNSSGQASYTTSTLSVGTHSIVAGYSGDAANPSSLSAALVQTVTNSSTQTASVAISGGGSVLVYDDSFNLQTTLTQSGSLSVPYGATRLFYFLPKSGSVLSQLSVGGRSMAPVSVIRAIMTQDYSISAVYSP